MRDNQFYQRLNQIRTKYGYSNQNQPIKLANLSFNKTQLTLQSYRDTMIQKEPYPQPSTPQRTYLKNYNVPQLQKNFALGNSPNRFLTKQVNLTNQSARIQEKIHSKQAQIQKNFSESVWFQNSKSNYKNTINEHCSPSPIKKFGNECGFQSSPVRKGQIIQKIVDNQALKPYNRVNNQIAAQFGLLQKIKQKEQITNQRDNVYPERINTSNNTQIKTFREQKSFQNQNLYSARPNNGFNEVKHKQSFELQQNINKDSVFMQKFNHNVSNIQKMQDKINAVLNRQK